MKKVLLTITVLLLSINFLVVLTGCTDNDMPKDAVDYDSCEFILNDEQNGYILRQKYKLFAKQPEGVLYIPEDYNGLPVLEVDSFATCHKITKIVGSKNLETIKQDAFSHRSNSGHMNITEVLFPSDSKLKEIEDYAFFNNRSLKKVVLGENINKIGSWCFYYCRGFENLTIYNTNPPEGADNLFGAGTTPKKFVVYVPESAVETYRNSEWGKYTIKAIEE